MARPKKQGLDYFPLDVDFFSNEKILAISGEFAVKGEIITLRLLCEIYQNGYFVEYSELLKNKLARLGGLSSGLIDEVVKKLVVYGFFDKAIFREHNILTSKSIQVQYEEATKRRKNNDKTRFWLLKKVNVDINPQAEEVNVDIYSQRKVKESKVNKTNNTLSMCKIEILPHKKEEKIVETPVHNPKNQTLNEKEKKIPPKKVAKKKVPAKNQTIEQRADTFKHKIWQIAKGTKYENPPILREFWEYWSEYGEKDHKMRYEKQTSFSITRRLGVWFRNQKNQPNNPFTNLKQDQINYEEF